MLRTVAITFRKFLKYSFPLAASRQKYKNVIIIIQSNAIVHKDAEKQLVLNNTSNLKQNKNDDVMKITIFFNKSKDALFSN